MKTSGFNFAAKRFGFCTNNHSNFHEVYEIKNLEYFQVLNQSTVFDQNAVLCQYSDNLNEDCETETELIHIECQKCFKDIDLKQMARFLNKRKVKSFDIDFELWTLFLHFLGASIKIITRLSILAKDLCNNDEICFYSIALTSAWKQFGIVCPKSKLSIIEVCEKNIDFFNAHDYEVFLTKEVDYNFEIPQELIELLNQKLFIIESLNIMLKSEKRCKLFYYDIEMIHNDDEQLVNSVLKHITEILRNNNYILFTSLDNNFITAVAPSKYYNIRIMRSGKHNQNAKKILHYHISSSALVSASVALYSSFVKKQIRNDIKKIDIIDDDFIYMIIVVQMKLLGCSFLPNIQQIIDEQVTQEDIYKSMFDFPCQDESLPFIGRVAQLEREGLHFLKQSINVALLKSL